MPKSFEDSKVTFSEVLHAVGHCAETRGKSESEVYGVSVKFDDMRVNEFKVYAHSRSS